MSPTDDHRPPPALQAERTTLAWLRTGLLCAALVTISVRLAETDTERLVGAVVGGMVALSGLAAAWLRMGDLQHVIEVPPVVRPACPALLTASVVAANLLALYFVVS
jgi:hypothetical protein